MAKKKTKAKKILVVAPEKKTRKAIAKKCRQFGKVKKLTGSLIVKVRKSARTKDIILYLGYTFRVPVQRIRKNKKKKKAVL